ncbi:proton-conducting transporter membrane subunit [Thiohalorhabdus methylotrophus]|uniref:Proton-conducting transporter membrane subunit n=1 Tax=Thiohalorhabdus methylotrophus TaxID=3242694 RepID=A0ABV4TPX9_9GAMM
MEADTLMVLAGAVPLVSAVLILAADRRPALRDGLVLLGALALLGVVVSLTLAFWAGERPYLEIAEPLPGVPLALTLEPLGVLFALVAGGLYAVTAVYAVGYMRGNEEHAQGPFHAWFALALAATMGVAFSANLFSLFIFYEVLTLSTWPLVTHHGDASARRGGRIYLGVLLATSVGFFLPALIWTWLAAGTLDFVSGGILAGNVAGWQVGLLLALYVLGIGKAAVMPVHSWLPAAMVAPTPVSALLHAVAVVKAGVFAVIKVVVYIFGLDLLRAEPSADLLMYAAGVTVVLASLVALRQDNLKRRLAYSTISQLSYVVMAALLFTPVAIVGAAMHIVAHAVSKITLFFAAGSIHTAAHKTEVSQLDGIGHRMPWTMGAFTVGAFSLIGIPPCIGVVSKWYILQGTFAAEELFPAGVLLISTLLNAAYFLPIVYVAFFRKADGHAHGEAPASMVFAITATALGVVALFFLPGGAISLARSVAGL